MSTADMIGGYRSGAREVVMPIAPLFHGNGWQMVYTAPMNGHKLVLPGRNFEPDRLYELMAAEQVTLAAAVPTVWLTLLDYMDSKGLRFGSLRAALVAGIQAAARLGRGPRGPPRRRSRAMLGHDRGAGRGQGDAAAWAGRRPRGGEGRAQAAVRAVSPSAPSCASSTTRARSCRAMARLSVICRHAAISSRRVT